MSSPVQLAARKYRWKYAGMLGFWIQRLTGLGLLFYLFLHVHTIHLLREPEKFQTALDQFGKPLFKLGEIGLLAAVILHALNGIRITMVDAGMMITKQRQMFWYFAMGVGAVLFIAGALPILIFTVLK
jgi:succinate dehydrogenase / fumarate reductase cytochrome b subunit